MNIRRILEIIAMLAIGALGMYSFGPPLSLEHVLFLLVLITAWSVYIQKTRKVPAMVRVTND